MRYKEKRNQVKRAVCVAKVNVDEGWDRKMSENLHENKMIWMDTEDKGGNFWKCREGEDRRWYTVDCKGSSKERWAEYFVVKCRGR